MLKGRAAFTVGKRWMVLFWQSHQHSIGFCTWHYIAAFYQLFSSQWLRSCAWDFDRTWRGDSDESASQYRLLGRIHTSWHDISLTIIIKLLPTAQWQTTDPNFRGLIYFALRSRPHQRSFPPPIYVEHKFDQNSYHNVQSTPDIKSTVNTPCCL